MNILFGQKYTVMMKTEDANALKQSLAEESDFVRQAGSDRWLIQPDDGTNYPMDKTMSLDFRLKEVRKYQKMTIQTDYGAVEDLGLFVRLKEQFSESLEKLSEVFGEVVETMSINKSETQNFVYGVESIFPEVDYQSILEPPMLDNPNGFDGKRTYLAVTIAEGKRDVIDALLAHPEIDVNLIDKNTDNALLWAVSKNDFETLEKLLKFPEIELNHKNELGYTALSIAKERNSTEVIKLLVNQGAKD